MYFRMLKKDLTNKIGLNITLFIFMILASVFIVISTYLLYSSFVGSEKTYEICNTSDIILITESSISDSEGARSKIKEFFENIPACDSLYISERMIYSEKMVEYVVDGELREPLSGSALMLAPVPAAQNIPYDLEDRLLTVPDGCVALPQNLLDNTSARVGDTIWITTQMGNIYAFTISAFYKDPSAYVYDRLLFSDADYAVLSGESPVKSDVYEIYLTGTESNDTDALLEIGNQLIANLEYLNITGFYNIKGRFSTNDGIIGLIVALALLVVSIFMIGMIFMTIHFSLKSAIKREEKEIGIMKAIGVYSFSYRALFAVKYIAFAIVGGSIGIPIAMPLGEVLMNYFMIHILLPSQSGRIVMAIAAVLCMILVIILFTFFSLRYMKQISVMDAIHGENRGERFRRIPGLFLHQKKTLNISLFLAANDILGRIKKYSYLILAYVFGICMVLMLIQIKDSICGMEYARKYLQINAMDFSMKINASYLSKLLNKEGSLETVYATINKIFEANDIPARADLFSSQTANVEFEEEKLSCEIHFGEFEYAPKIEYIKGGTAPILYNEVAVAYHSARLAGIELGDIITIEYDKYNEDHISYEKVRKEFVVTAYFNGQCFGVTPIIMGEEFDDAVPMEHMLFQYKIDCPESEYQEYYDRMDALFTDDEILFKPRKEAFEELLQGYNTLFNLLIAVVSTAVAVVLVLITMLYENIFIEEETRDMAVLKSMGFDRGIIKRWHLARILLLVVMSYVLAIIFSMTIGNPAMGKLVSKLIYVYGFEIVTRFFTNFVVVPVSVILLITLCMLPMLKAVNKIQIWRIRDE